MPSTERALEQWFASEVQSHGGLSAKFKTRHWPDRLVVLPNVAPFFVELKRPGEDPERKKAQVYYRTCLRLAGCRVYVCATRDECRKALDEVQA